MAELIVTPPAVEPVTVAGLKAQLNITSTADDALLDRKLKASRQAIERLLGRPMINTTYEEYYDSFPSGEIKLPRSPVQSVTSVKYIDASTGLETTVAADKYDVDKVSAPARLAPSVNSSGWPAARGQLNAVIIRYIAGYGAAAADVPEPIREAVLELAAHWYENREASLVGVSAEELPFGVAEVVREYRDYSFG